MLKIQNMMNIKEVLLLWFQVFLIKKSSGSDVNNEIKQNEQLTEELYKSQLLENLKKEKLILHLKTAFGVMI